MSDWKTLPSGIMVPGDKPPMIEERRESARERYQTAHACCPACGSGQIETTTIGSISPDPDTYGDVNDATCHGCGWKGAKSDMVPEKPQDRS